jgi:hypothetical protein
MIAMVLAGAPFALAASKPIPMNKPIPFLRMARLQGLFHVTGVVTAAVRVPGEHRGEHVSRTWAFIPSCPAAGVCPTIRLVRTRANGIDKLVLHRRRPDFYSGVGAFVAPARCGGRLYRHGEQVPFRITVRITAAVVQGTAIQATRFDASYRNRVRTGLTRCVSIPSYDSARYVGVAPPPGLTRNVASARSSTAS